MEGVTLLGLIAGTLTTVSVLPQVVKAWKTRHTKDVSLIMFLILFTGVALWFVYGLLIGDVPVVVANGITMVFVMTMIVFKIRFG
jgi:MtN3 and saliva related transmembrane protein